MRNRFIGWCLVLFLVPSTVFVFSQALHQSVMDGDLTQVVKHIANGSNVNEKDSEEGKTALHYAVSYDNINIVKALIVAKTDVNQKDNLGRTALHYAVNCDYVDNVEKVDIVKALIAAKSDVNQKDNSGATPIFYANNTDILKVLLAARADISATNLMGETPLHAYITNCNTLDMVKLLIANKANVNAKNTNGMTPLHCLAGMVITANSEFIKLLLTAKANVNAKDNIGRTPLFLALNIDHEAAVLEEQALREKGNVGAFLDDNYDSILSSVLNTVKILVAAKADVNIKDDSGESPFDIACRWPERVRERMKKYLKSVGAK